MLRATLCSLMLTACAASHANLIVDGSFEGLPGGHAPNNGSYYDSSAYASTNNADMSSYIDGWTVYAPGTFKNAQWITNGSYASINAFDGIGLIDLTGNPDNGPAALQQSFVTTSGTAYKVTFYLGYAQVNQGFGGPVSATVSNGGTNAQLFTAGPGTGNQTSTVWTQFEYDFTATGDHSLLRIQGTSAAGVFLGLDMVDVELGPTTPKNPSPNGAVPEPGSLALAGIGLLALVARKRRRA